MPLAAITIVLDARIADTAGVGVWVRGRGRHEPSWTDAMVQRGLVAEVCWREDEQLCDVGRATMVVTLFDLTRTAEDRVTSQLLLYGEDRRLFMALWSIELRRVDGSWHLATRRLRLIT